MIGKIIKAYSGEFVVKTDEGVFKALARGNLKKEGVLVGDTVEFDGGAIAKVYPRKNRLFRPNVANIDLVALVLSPVPEPDYYLVDKTLINANAIGAEVIIVVNKTDIDDTLYNYVQTEYGNTGVKILTFSAKNKEGINELKEQLKNKLTVLAGQSAAGKTSIVNALFDLNLKTGELAQKTNRGRHTTTASEIFYYEGIELVDSPGFAVIEALVSKDEFKDCYPEYSSVAEGCRFRGCAHINEPDCKVKKLVEEGKLSSARYNRYKEIYQELSKRRNDYEQN